MMIPYVFTQTHSATGYNGNIWEFVAFGWAVQRAMRRDQALAQVTRKKMPPRKMAHGRGPARWKMGLSEAFPFSTAEPAQARKLSSS